MPTFQQMSFILALSLFTSPVFSTMYYEEEIDEDYEKILSKKLLKKIDTNKDKKVSFEELLSYKNKKAQQVLNSRIESLFKHCDKNKDDKIDPTEAIKAKPDDADYYHDYTLPSDSKPQKCTFNTDRLTAYDNNEDGFLDRKEAGDAVNFRPTKKAKKQREERITKQQNAQLKNIFKTCDKNQDQQLSFREAASMNCNMVTEQFDAHDKNKDNYLSLKEHLLDVQYSDDPQTANTINMENNTLSNDSNSYQKNSTPLNILQNSFDTCDKNEDQRLAKSETISKNCTLEMWFFNQTDQNNDGFINSKELQAAELKDNFDDMDTDKNGLLEGKEFKGSRVRHF